MVSRANSLNPESAVVDIVAEDRDGAAILMAEVKFRPFVHDYAAQLAEYLRLVSPPVPFGMVICPDIIVAYTWDGRELREVLRLETIATLRAYDPDLGKSHIFADHLAALTGSWLRDLAYHWKLKDPPGHVQLRSAGLVDRLKGGTTRSEVTLGRGPLS